MSEPLCKNRHPVYGECSLTRHTPMDCDHFGGATWTTKEADALTLLRIATDALDKISERQAAPASEACTCWEIADEALARIVTPT